ncbi:MAG: chlorite dismutase [Hyphomicrobium sp.]|nr:MAG: chlorite dismutase [Hyphomicrobium sp.]
MHNQFAFTAGRTGTWRISSIDAVRGAGLEPAAGLDITDLSATPLVREQGSAPAWVLLGTVSNVRYATRPELTEMRAKQEGLGRPNARRAALIPIKKSAAWWDLAQDERRAIFEETSHHTAIGMEYLPAVARKLFHSRDIGEPFDFLTWFEFAADDAAAFEHMVGRLRATREWTYVEREVDIRLER